MKDILLICDKNCATYKEVFPLFKQGIVSFGSPVKQYDGTDKKFGNHGWITAFPVANKKKLVLTATYDPDKYPKYDNYDAIEVSRVKDIPYDYDGVMGVPITFLDHYNPEQFEILGMCENLDLYKLKTKVYTTEECKDAYYAKFGKEGVYDLNASGVMIRNGKLEKVYQRILIRRKK